MEAEFTPRDSFAEVNLYALNFVITGLLAQGAASSPQPVALSTSFGTT
jgi:hypothetical protein